MDALISAKVTSKKIETHTVFDLISTRGAYGNLLSFTSAKRSRQVGDNK